MTTYAVTGASGHLGRLAIEALVARGIAPERIVAIARHTEKITNLSDRNVVVRHGDYDEPDTLVAALSGVNNLLLVSASEPGNRVAQHQAVIEAAKSSGVNHIVYTSILGAPTTSNPLAPEHVATEALIAASGIPSTLLRNSWYFENYTAQMGQYKASGAIVGATKNALLSAATRADYADAAAAALIEAKGGSVYELAGPSFTLTDLAATIAAATETPVEYQDMSVNELAAVLEGFGMDAGAAAMFASVDGSIANGELLHDSDDLESLIGRKATSLADAVAAAIA